MTVQQRPTTDGFKDLNACISIKPDHEISPNQNATLFQSLARNLLVSSRSESSHTITY